MKFNSNLNIDFDKWSHAKMERETNKVDGKIAEEDMPKYLFSFFLILYILSWH